MPPPYTKFNGIWDLRDLSSIGKVQATYIMISDLMKSWFMAQSIYVIHPMPAWVIGMGNSKTAQTKEI